MCLVVGVVGLEALVVVEEVFKVDLVVVVVEVSQFGAARVEGREEIIAHSMRAAGICMVKKKGRATMET